MAQWSARLPRCMFVQKRCGPVVSESALVVYVQKRRGPVVSESDLVDACRGEFEPNQMLPLFP